MKISEPYWGYAACQTCAYEWQIFLPDGCNNSKELECPNCREMKGKLKESES